MPCPLAFGGGNETTRFCQSCCRLSGSVCMCGARTAARPHAAHRRALERGRGRSGQQSTHHGIPAAVGAIGLDRRHNVRIDYRFVGGDPENYSKYAAELVALAPDVIVASGASLPVMLQATRTVPVVFAFAADPVGAGYIESLSRPGGNATGFLLFEYDLSAKWLELLKEIAPGVTRVAVLRNPTEMAGIGQFAIIQSVARSVGVDVSVINLRDAGEIEQAVTAFARSSNGGLVVVASALATVQRALLIELAARHRLPTVYFERTFVAGGGLISYGADLAEGYRRAAGYVDRILKGEKPADLPVQAPTKYELAINLKTAKTLGLTIPPAVLARADTIIE
jgi:putative ABC transport system substrate-binding protein